VNHKTFRLLSEDKREFHCYQWNNPSPHAIVQIVHGIAEHAMRYEHFAEALVKKGFAVFAEDHRGHGQTAGLAKGDMGPANALDRVCDDVVRLTLHARSEFPGIPVVLFGHSMGSLISQLVLQRNSDLYQAVVLSGSPSVDVLAQARPMIEQAVAVSGRDAPAEALQMAMFGAFMEGIANPRTPFDWLSRDPAEVDRYIEDPLCGFIMTNGAFQDIAAAAARTTDPQPTGNISADLAMLILSGSADPAHLGGTALEQLHSRYSEMGLTRLSKRIYPEGRHEMLNEINRGEVIGDIIAWMSEATAKTS